MNKRKNRIMGIIMILAALIILITVTNMIGNRKKEEIKKESEGIYKWTENLIEDIASDNIYKLDSLLTSFKFNYFHIDGYDRSDFDVEKMAAISFNYAKNRKTEEIDGYHYFTTDKNNVDKVAKDLFNIEIDTNKLRNDLYEAIYIDKAPIAFKDNKYIVTSANGRMPWCTSLADSIIKSADGIYRIDFTIYDSMYSKYMAFDTELIRNSGLENCVAIGKGVLEVKEEVVDGKTIYYIIKYDEEVETKR